MVVVASDDIAHCSMCLFSCQIFCLFASRFHSGLFNFFSFIENSSRFLAVCACIVNMSVAAKCSSIDFVLVFDLDFMHKAY